MGSIGELSPLQHAVKEGNALVREARTNAVELTLAIDTMLGSMIAEYFTRHRARFYLLFEILTLLTTSQKIDAFGNLETVKGVQYGKQHSLVVKRLRRFIEFRNALVHGFPTILPDTKLWRGRGKLSPYPLTPDSVENEMELGEEAFDALSGIFEQMMEERQSRKRKGA